MERNGGLPDELRCHRTDGRRWRCNRPVTEGKKLCDIHHLQGRHRQYKTKVPESLKIQRKFKGPGSRNDESAPPEKAVGKRRKKKQGGKGELELELLRMVLKRDVEKKSKKRKVGVLEEEEEEEELTRDLPNGLMAISPPSLNKLNHLSNVASCSSFRYSPCDVKVGAESNVDGGGGTRSFRSKNIEPLPVGKLQDVPFRMDVMRMRRKKRSCHCCRRRDLAGLIRCSSCRKEFFCSDCIKDQYFDKQEEVKMACPVCQGTCCCKTCLEVHCRDIESKGAADEKNKVDKVLNFHYLICVLLPVLKQINEDHNIELEIEANVRGQKPSDVEIRELEVGCSKQCCCNNCKTSIADLHRSCPNCSYNLCLSCSRDILQGSLPGGLKSLPFKSCNRVATRPASSSKWGFGHRRRLDSSILMPKLKGQNGGISCPPSGFGGCGDSFLDLTCMFPSDWIKELEVSAEEVVSCYDLPEPLDASSSCPICLEINHAANGINQLQEAARREDSNDNHLFCPITLDLRNDNLDHFQKHWGKGQPVIVRGVLKASEQSWDPIVMFCTYLKNNVAKSENEKIANCLDWFEVEIGLKQLFMGSFKGPSNSFQHEKLKLRGWLSSHLFQEHFPAHYAEILRFLPLPEYTDPSSGILNIASEMPPEITKPDLGPFVYISYGSGEASGQSDNVTKLRYDSYDGVNILVHASTVPVSTEQLNYIRKLMKKHKEKNACEDESGDREEVEDVELHDMIRKETQLHRKVARVSWFSAATHEPVAANLGDQEILHEGIRDSLTDSDTDTDTEVSKFFFGPLKTSWNSVNHTCSGKNAKSVNHFHKVEIAETCGAQWDVFRRQDVPKLVEYLKRHFNEFSHTSSYWQAVHTILDQNLFLDSVHKMRLKEEFDIEPWSFEQHVGEAVIVPAGCPYQIRNLKVRQLSYLVLKDGMLDIIRTLSECDDHSCVSVALDFISPENVTECIQLVDELRLLPDNHKAKVDSLEVTRMAVHSSSRAVKEIRELTQAE